MRNFKINLREDNENVFITAYIHKRHIKFGQAQWQRADRPALIVCPGGSYYHLVDKESEPIVWPFLAKGYNVFVLNYSVGEYSVFPNPLHDLAKTVAHIRHNADEYGINKNQIVCLGFSAGGNLVAMLGNMWNNPSLVADLQLQADDIKPNAQILAYALLGKEGLEEMENQLSKLKSDLNFIENDEQKRFSSTYLNAVQCGTILDITNLKIGHILVQQADELDIIANVNINTPPSFIWHTREDKMVPAVQALSFASKLQTLGKNYELHIWAKGEHGLARADNESYWNQRLPISIAKWIDLSFTWLEELFNNQ